MHSRRQPHRFISQVSLFALLFSSLPIPAIAGARPVADPVFTDLAGGDLPTRPPPRKTGESAPAGPTAASVTALCDPDLGEGGAGGQGSRILKFPPASDRAEHQKALLAYIAERRKNILEANSQRHHAFSSHQNPAWPNLATSMEARNKMFDQIFGQDSVVYMVCQAKRDLSSAQDAFNLAQQKKAQETGGGSNACSGADEEMKLAYGKAEESYKQLSNFIEVRLEGGVAENKKRYDSIKTLFYSYRSINRNVNRTQLKAKPVPAHLEAELKDEFNKLWGHGSVDHPDHSKSIDSNGFYSDVILQTIQEKKEADKKSVWLNDNKAKMDALKERCKTAGAPPKSTSTDTSTDLTGPGARRPPPGGERPPPGGETPPPGGERPPPGGERPPPGGENPPDTSGGSKPPSKGMSSGMKTGLIVVGGAAAVGAALFAYKRHQDNKKAKEWADNPSNYLPSNTTYVAPVVSGGSGSSTDTAPSGSKLVLVSAVGNVAQGATLPPIEVQLVDSGGVPLTVNGLTINVSCLMPSPCSLTGPQSVTTVDGKVSFNDLKFNQAHTGVRLQFSASGVATLASPNFDVTPTSVRRDETVETGTGTGTSTNTDVRF